MSFLQRNGWNLLLLGIFLVFLVLSFGTFVPRANGQFNLPLLIDFIDWNIAASILQGFAAVAIVALTYQLAQTARAALTTSADQVKAAQDATVLTRRDAHIAAVPRLELKRTWIDQIGHPDNPDLVTVTLGNVGDEPALDIYISVDTGTSDGVPSDDPKVRERIGTLQPGKDKQVDLDLHAFRNRAKPTDTRVPREAKWSENFITFSVEFRASLGQQVKLTYLWIANHPDERDEAECHTHPLLGEAGHRGCEAPRDAFPVTAGPLADGLPGSCQTSDPSQSRQAPAPRANPRPQALPVSRAAAASLERGRP